LGRDIALALGTLGHIICLKRIQSGNFLLKDCYPLDFLEKIDHKGREALLRPAQEGLDDIPVFWVTQEETHHLWRGMPVQSDAIFANRIISCLCEKHLVALAKVNDEGIAFPFRCFCDVQL
jgi:tRNA pseudouridine55 synthase